MKQVWYKLLVGQRVAKEKKIENACLLEGGNLAILRVTMIPGTCGFKL